MATDQFSTWQFLKKGNQTDTDSSITMAIWLKTVFTDENARVHLGLILCTFICFLITFVIGFVQFMHVYKYISVIRLKNNMYYLIFLNPISSICCFFGMASPRNAAFMYGVILSYHMLAIRIALDVMFNINGGRVTLSKMLMMNNEKIRFTFFPFCFFGKCMPSFTPTVTNIGRFEMIVSQTCVVRVVLMIIDICVYREVETLNNGWFFVSHLVSVISTMIALYFSYAISGVNRDNSKKFRFQYLFMMVDWSQTLITFQKTGFDILSTLGLYPLNIFPKQLLERHFSESIYILFFLYSLEVLFMSALISFLLRPSKSYIFDKYAGPRLTTPPTYMYLDDSDEGLLRAVMESESQPPPSIPSQPSQPSQNEQPVSQMQQPATGTTTTGGGESQMQDPKEGVTVKPSPETLIKLEQARTPTEEKKPVVVGGAVDDGAYENLKSQSERSMHKVLQEQKAAEEFFKVPPASSDKKESVSQMTPPNS